ncbi:MAG TPA: kelch repeat-containing protein, partial [Polyangia bacterium]
MRRFQVVVALALCGSWMGCSQKTTLSSKSSAVVERASVPTPAAPPPAGTWTTLSAAWPVDANIMVMTDGTLLGMASQTGACYRLAPTSAGLYDTSSWTSLTSMHDPRLYFGSNVLPDGRVFVVGGEYGSGGGKGEVYDPVANTWGSQFTAAGVADTETALLPDGTVYIAWISKIWNPATNMLTDGPAFPNAHYDEAGFVLLPDQSFLTIPMDETTAYRYIPAQNKFVEAGAVQQLFDSGSEIGPGILLPSGKVLWIGANGKSAIWTPPATASDIGSWVNGPDTPSSLMADDAPAAMLPNGHVLFVADKGKYVGPATVFEFDPSGAGSITASAGAPSPGVAYTSRMVVLPTGQILLSDGSAGYLYTPGVTADPSWRPTITTVVPKGSGVYELTGTQLHGVNEGSSYGDDAEMSSNFPLVRFESGGGSTITYARTFGWSPALVGLGSTPQKTQFQLPSLSDGSYNLVVVTNGIASSPQAVTVVGGNLVINDFSLNKPTTITVAQGGSAMAMLTTTKTQG